MFFMSKHLDYHCCKCAGLNHIARDDEESGSSRHVDEPLYFELDSVITTGCRPNANVRAVVTV